MGEPGSEAADWASRFDDAVFISYTHVDNEPFGPEQLRWISHLHAQLGNRVQQLYGDRVSVWRDEKLQGNDVFAETLADRLARVGVLVSVCSPRYLKSEWCRRELDAFVAAAEAGGGLHAGTRSRVFKVLKTPVPLNELPDELQPVLGYEFFEDDPAGGRAREYLLNPDPEQRWKFYARVDDLAHDIADLLGELASGGTPEAAGDGGRTVYLAETASDVAPERDRLRRELERRGHRVLPTRSLPLDAAELAAAVETALDGTDLAIHLLGARYGVRPEGDERSVPHIQLDVASASGRPQLVWAPDRVDSPGPAQAALLERLQAGGLGENAELVRGPLESFNAYALDQLAPAPPPATTPAAPGDGARVYLIADRPDREVAAALQSQLEAAGHVVMVPLTDGTEAEAQDVHQMSMVLSDAVLIYYGHATEHWLRMKLFDLLKAPGWGRSEPFRAAAVYVAPPDTPHKAGYDSTEALVLRAGAGAAALDPFLARLAAS